MTTATLTRAEPIRLGFGLGALRTRMVAALERRRAYRQTVLELSWLSDRELADLGLMRCDIHRIAREAAGL